jgi:hypothetical protein
MCFLSPVQLIPDGAPLAVDLVVVNAVSPVDIRHGHPGLGAPGSRR